MKLYTTGEIIINPTPLHFGRSFYICYNIDCINNVMKKKKLQKILKGETPANIIKTLEEYKLNGLGETVNDSRASQNL
jgi:predicted RNA-binding protein YlxR (DUF448 family)